MNPDWLQPWWTEWLFYSHLVQIKWVSWDEVRRCEICDMNTALQCIICVLYQVRYVQCTCMYVLRQNRENGSEMLVLGQPLWIACFPCYLIGMYQSDHAAFVPYLLHLCRAGYTLGCILYRFRVIARFSSFVSFRVLRGRDFQISSVIIKGPTNVGLHCLYAYINESRLFFFSGCKSLPPFSVSLSLAVFLSLYYASPQPQIWCRATAENAFFHSV